MAEQNRAAKLSSRIETIFKGSEPVYAKMERFMKRYKGEWWNPDVDDNQAKIHANYIFSTVETVAPLLTDNRPIWSVRARQSFMQNHLEAFSVALEYLWDKLRMDKKVFKWVKDCLIMKIGIMKARWDTEKNEVAIDNVDPRTFFNAPGYNSLDDTPMCGERMEKPMSWIRFKYPDKWKQVVSNDPQAKEMVNLEDWELEEHKTKVYEVWMRDNSVEEYYVDADGNQTDDKKAEKRTRRKFPNGKIVTLTSGVILDEKPSPFQHGMPPYVELYDYMVPYEFWGMSEPDQIEEMNLSFNRSLQLMHTWMTTYADPPWVLDPNSGMGKAEDIKRQLKAGGAVFEAMQTGSVPPLSKIDAPPINNTVPMLMNAIQRLMEEVSGVTDVSKGQVGKSQRQSATEISTLIESAYTRMRQRVRNLEDSLSRLLYMMISMMQQFYTELREFQIQGEGGPQRFTVSNRRAFAQTAIGGRIPGEENGQADADIQRFIKQFGKEDPIYAAFDLTVDTNSTLPMDKQSKANMFLRLLELAVNDPTKAMPMWRATIETLRLPNGSRIIQEMEQATVQAAQAAVQQPGQLQVEGPRPVSDILREAQ